MHPEVLAPRLRPVVHLMIIIVLSVSVTLVMAVQFSRWKEQRVQIQDHRSLGQFGLIGDGDKILDPVNVRDMQVRDVGSSYLKNVGFELVINNSDVNTSLHEDRGDVIIKGK